MKYQLEIQYKNEVSDFLKGMLIGDKNGLSDEVKDDFKESGLIHLLAVSGLHISLAGRRVYKLVRKWCGNFVVGSLAGMTGAVFYCILTGGSESSLRAVMMLGVYFLSEILGEHYDMLSAGAFAGCVAPDGAGPAASGGEAEGWHPAGGGGAVEPEPLLPAAGGPVGPVAAVQRRVRL